MLSHEIHVQGETLEPFSIDDPELENRNLSVNTHRSTEHPEHSSDPQDQSKDDLFKIETDTPEKQDVSELSKVNQEILEGDRKAKKRGAEELQGGDSSEYLPSKKPKNDNVGESRLSDPLALEIPDTGSPSQSSPNPANLSIDEDFAQMQTSTPKKDEGNFQEDIPGQSLRFSAANTSSHGLPDQQFFIKEDHEAGPGSQNRREGNAHGASNKRNDCALRIPLKIKERFRAPIVFVSPFLKTLDGPIRLQYHEKNLKLIKKNELEFGEENSRIEPSYFVLVFSSDFKKTFRCSYYVKKHFFSWLGFPAFSKDKPPVLNFNDKDLEHEMFDNLNLKVVLIKFEDSFKENVENFVSDIEELIDNLKKIYRRSVGQQTEQFEVAGSIYLDVKKFPYMEVLYFHNYGYFGMVAEKEYESSKSKHSLRVKFKTLNLNKLNTISKDLRSRLDSITLECVDMPITQNSIGKKECFLELNNTYIVLNLAN